MNKRVKPMKDLVIDVLDRPEHKDGLSMSEIDCVIRKESSHPESYWEHPLADFPFHTHGNNLAHGLARCLFELKKKEIIVRVRSTRKYKMPLRIFSNRNFDALGDDEDGCGPDGSYVDQ